MSDAERRYVVLHHTAMPACHYDFLFENEPGDERLTTFRCPRWPLQVGDVLEELAEHRRAYLEYEGPLSGNRGRVDRVDAGTITVMDLSVDPPTLGLRMRSEGASVIEIVLSEVGATTRWIVTRVGV